MALLLLESFNSYTTSTDLGDAWTRNGNMTLVTSGGQHGNCAHVIAAGITSSAFLCGSQAAGTRIHTVGYINFKTALPNSGDTLFRWFNESGSGPQLIWRANHKLAFRDWGNNTDLATEGGTAGYLDAIATGTWVHFEAEVIVSDSGAGACKVWLDKNLIINYSGSTGTGSAAITRLSLGGSSLAPCDWDQLVFYNDSGSYAPAQLGLHEIELVRPDADGSTLQWTPLGGGSHYVEIDEVFKDSSTSYNSTSTNGFVDLYSYADPSPVSQNIAAVQQVHVISTQSVAGQWNALCHSGGTNYDGTARNSTPFYSPRFYDWWYDDPATSAAWTLSGLTSAEFGIKRVSGSSQFRLTQMYLEVLMVEAGSEEHVAASPALGLSMAALIERAANAAASQDLGFSMSVSLENAVYLPIAKALGLDVAAVVDTFFTIAASKQLGLGMSAALSRIANPSSDHGLGISMAAAVHHGVDADASADLGLEISVAVDREVNFTPLASLGLDMAAILDAVFTLPLTEAGTGVAVAANLITGPTPPRPVIIICS